MEDSTVGAFLRDHPKLLGALFGATVLLSQAGSALAGGSVTISGP